MIRTGNLQQFILTLVKDFPELAAEVISAGADEFNDLATAKARRIPIASQIAALTAISRLSMEDAGGLKNLLAEMQARLNAAAGVGEEQS